MKITLAATALAGLITGLTLLGASASGTSTPTAACPAPGTVTYQTCLQTRYDYLTYSTGGRSVVDSYQITIIPVPQAPGQPASVVVPAVP